jgi:hypothetical protein
VTTAVNVVVPFTCTVGGVAFRLLTLGGGGGSTVKLTVPLLLGSATEVTVTETGRVVPAARAVFGDV